MGVDESGPLGGLIYPPAAGKTRLQVPPRHRTPSCTEETATPNSTRNNNIATISDQTHTSLPTQAKLQVAIVTSAGLVALAVAMGIGRFAFTPILPMMQADANLNIAAAGWLAAANYLGYLSGAVAAARLPRAAAIRGGLLVIAVVTFAMGLSQSFTTWLILRFAAGVASACVLVHVAAWAMSRLENLTRPQASGLVFAGVGVGIAVSGLLCMILMHLHATSNHTWEAFGVVSLVITVLIWRAFSGTHQSQPAVAQWLQWDGDRLRLVLCYGAYGFGYIIPATFLPAMAHQYISDPLIFGWAWPVFGTAAALSTWASSRWLRGINTRKLWAGSYVLMATGVVLPVLWPTLIAILIAALLVGGTFMVATMLGLREAQRVGGAQATALIAALTAAFALAQAAGPMFVSLVSAFIYGLQFALVSAALVLLAGAVALWRSTPRYATGNSPI